MSDDIFSQLQADQSSKKFKRVPEPGESSLVAMLGTALVVAAIGVASIPQIKGMLIEGDAVATSSEALFRVRQNPLRGVDAKRHEVVFQEGMTIYDASTMRRIVNEGAIVANRAGDTAIVKGGVLTEIRRINSTDRPAFTQWLKQDEWNRSRTPGV